MGHKTDQRKHARLPIERTALIQHGDDKVHQGQTSNISFGGAYISLAEQEGLCVGDICELALQLGESLDSIEIFFKVRIVRLDERGIAIRFILINAESYRHFEQLMVNASPDPIRLLVELDENRGLAINREPLEQPAS